MRWLLLAMLLLIPSVSFAVDSGLSPGHNVDGARQLAPSGRGWGFRVDAPAAREAADVLAVRPASDRPLAFVTRAVDGDTLRLRDGAVVRLIGVDTPETKHPAKPVQWCGPEASGFTRAAIEKRWVALERDREPRDRYGRWLAYVTREPERFFLNGEIVRQGAGRAYTRFPFRHRDWFVELERAAREEKLGIWGGKRGACNLPAPDVARVTPPGEAPRAAAPEPVPEPTPAQPEPQARAPEAAREPTQTPRAPVAPPVVAPAAPPGAAPAPATAARREAGPGTGCAIKGNIGRDGERIYHVPGGQLYSRTKVDESAGERWFCTEEEARAAGWRRSMR